MDRNWSGYRTKSEYLLKCIADDCNELGVWDDEKHWPIPRDGDWFQLGRAYNVGGKLLLWMVENNLLERRGVKSGNGIESMLADWYRAAADPDADLGDWWIE